MNARLFACLVLVAGAAGAACAEEPPGAKETVVLSTQSYWRAHVTLRPAMYGTAANPQPRTEAQTARLREPPLAQGQPMGYTHIPATPPDQPRSAPPPADWAQPEFDDSAWWRSPGPLFSDERAGRWGLVAGYYSPSHIDRLPLSTAMLSLRGSFTVPDPAQAGRLLLSVSFRGGAVIYLNGSEVARSHLPPGPINADTLAEDCPPETFLTPDGAPLGSREVAALKDPASDSAEARALRERLDLRVRRIERLELPARLLRRGSNVVGIELHRSAVPSELPFCPAGLVDVELTASGGSTVELGLGRPKGLQVWNADLLEDVLNVDWGTPSEPLRPIRIIGARNGAFSGQVVASSDADIRGLRAECSILRRRGGTESLPAESCTVWYPQFGPNTGAYLPARPDADPRLQRGGCGFSTLSPTPPAEVAAIYAPPGHSSRRPIGAVQPVWLRVRIPADARPGEYEGSLRLAAEGFPGAEVPVHLRVCGWRLPDGRDYQMLMDFVQSPESVALYYHTPLWSDDHFERMAPSLRLLGEVGCKTVYIPLIARTHFGNAQTMVRWVRQPGGGYQFDFSLMERYLDLCEAHLGKPRLVCFYLHDYSLGTAERHAGWAAPYMGREPAATVPVTALDPETGKESLVQVPRYGGQNAAALWKPMADELVRRMRERRLDKAMALGLVGDLLPPKDYVAFWRELLPGVPWAIHSHGVIHNLYGVPVAYRAGIFGTRFAVDPACRRYHGWQRTDTTTLYPRCIHPALPRSAFRLLPEWAIQGVQNGLGRMPADFFLAPGEKRPLYDRYAADTTWGTMSLSRTGSWLAPGPDGAVPTVRFELLREGIQECEARIWIEQILTDKDRRERLGPELAERCQAVLDERTRCAIRFFSNTFAENCGPENVLPGGPLPLQSFAGSGWQERSAALYDAAADVAERIGAEN